LCYFIVYNIFSILAVGESGNVLGGDRSLFWA